MIKVVSKMKLLGVIVRDNLKWSANTARIRKKALGRMEIIRRLNHYSIKLSKVFANAIIYLKTL